MRIVRHHVHLTKRMTLQKKNSSEKRIHNVLGKKVWNASKRHKRPKYYEKIVQYFDEVFPVPVNVVHIFNIASAAFLQVNAFYD